MAFKTIGIIAKKPDPKTGPTVEATIAILKKLDCKLLLEEDIETFCSPGSEFACQPVQSLYDQADLIVCIGGDGTLLNVVKDIAFNPIPVVGINLGRLGFLVDIDTSHLETHLTEIIQGAYTLDQRTLLQAEVIRDKNVIFSTIALNDFVMCKSAMSRMIEFECYVNNKFLTSQRSDGIIISTPTGSTAYSLSAGGPIVMPQLEALSIVSVCPHTMSQRPVVLPIDSVIDLYCNPQTFEQSQFDYDGNFGIKLAPSDHIRIKQHVKKALILHPKNYDYYEVLRRKLGWGTQL